MGVFLCFMCLRTFVCFFLLSASVCVCVAVWLLISHNISCGAFAAQLGWPVMRIIDVSTRLILFFSCNCNIACVTNEQMCVLDTLTIKHKEAARWSRERNKNRRTVRDKKTHTQGHSNLRTKKKVAQEQTLLIHTHKDKIMRLHLVTRLTGKLFFEQHNRLYWMRNLFPLVFKMQVTQVNEKWCEKLILEPCNGKLFHCIQYSASHAAVVRPIYKRRDSSSRSHYSSLKLKGVDRQLIVKCIFFLSLVHLSTCNCINASFLPPHTEWHEKNWI